MIVLYLVSLLLAKAIIIIAGELESRNDGVLRFTLHAVRFTVYSMREVVKPLY